MLQFIFKLHVNVNRSFGLDNFPRRRHTLEGVDNGCARSVRCQSCNDNRIFSLRTVHYGQAYADEWWMIDLYKMFEILHSTVALIKCPYFQLQ